MLLSLLCLTVLSVASCAPLWPILFPRDHPRYVAPAVVADVPDLTYHGGLL